MYSKLIFRLGECINFEIAVVTEPCMKVNEKEENIEVNR
jgi:hypothetical protein